MTCEVFLEEDLGRVCPNNLDPPVVLLMYILVDGEADIKEVCWEEELD